MQSECIWRERVEWVFLSFKNIPFFLLHVVDVVIETAAAQQDNIRHTTHIFIYFLETIWRFRNRSSLELESIYNTYSIVYIQKARAILFAYDCGMLMSGVISNFRHAHGCFSFCWCFTFRPRGYSLEWIFEMLCVAVCTAAVNAQKLHACIWEENWNRDFYFY